MHKLGRLTGIATAMLLVLGTATGAMACAAAPVPEIDPTNAVAALALVAGATLIIRGRRKKT